MMNLSHARKTADQSDYKTLTFKQAMEHQIVVHAIGDCLCCVFWCKLDKSI